MKTSQLDKESPISSQVISSICKKLEDNKPVRKSLLEGRIHIDRQLPFLCVYREPDDIWDRGTDQMVTSEASYLVCSGESRLYRSLHELVWNIVETLSQIFGAFLVVEIWSAPEEGHEPGEKIDRSEPKFKISTKGDMRLSTTIDELQAALLKTRILKRTPKVEIIPGPSGPMGMRPLLSEEDLQKLNCYMIGLELYPVYRHAASEREFPMVRRAVVRSLSPALKRAFYEFTRSQTSRRPPHYQALGKRAFVKAVWTADQRMAAISDSFDLLLHLNPVNINRAWSEFQSSRYERMPRLLYPRLPFEPAAYKKKLYAIPMETIEDPVVEEIFHEKRDELDRQFTLLHDRGSRRFLYGSLQLYGGVDDSLLQVASDLLDRIPSRTRDDTVKGSVTAAQFRRQAQKEIDRYRAELSQFTGSCQIYDGPSSLMVSRGVLMIGKRMKIPKKRVEALIQHEIGTHMVTYFNAQRQPFRMLHTGLAGYDEMQEGLAVLAEYLCGGLSRPRLRLLAARVIAVKMLIDGASFIDVFRELDRTLDFDRKSAFTITLRVFRGGGLTKDAVYLRGLIALLDYFSTNGAIAPLFIGKFALKHIPIIEELLARKVLHATPLMPYYMRKKETAARLKKLHKGLSVFDLTEREKT